MVNGLNTKIGMLIGMVILLAMVVALAPTMFTGLNNISGAPAWLGTVLPIIVAAALVILAWRSFN